jgi:predicted GNAT superfamily acetyltransferase
MSPDAPEVRELRSLPECASVDPLFAAIWGPASPPIGVELLRAMAHSGAYVAGAYHRGELVGASVGFVTHQKKESLHSHVTGVAATARGLGVGSILKGHQRQWAVARGIGFITWTFDPLVRRNAWFNLAKLGASPREYLVDFYGSMPDDINRADESDRLYVEWDLAAEPSEVDTTAAAHVVADVDGTPVTEPVEASLVLVATPQDIEDLRRHDPDRARLWRHAVREALTAEMTRGQVVGFTRAGEYVVRRRATSGRDGS